MKKDLRVNLCIIVAIVMLIFSFMLSVYSLRSKDYLTAVEFFLLSLFLFLLNYIAVSLSFGRRFGNLVTKRINYETLSFVTFHVWLGAVFSFLAFFLSFLPLLNPVGNIKSGRFLFLLVLSMFLFLLFLYYLFLNPKFGTGRVYITEGGVVIDGARKFTLVARDFQVKKDYKGGIGEGVLVDGYWDVERKKIFSPNVTRRVRKSIFLNAMYIGNADPDEVRRVVLSIPNERS